MKFKILLLTIIPFFTCAFLFAQYTPLNGPEGGRFENIEQVGTEIWAMRYIGDTYYRRNVIFRSGNGGITWYADSSITHNQPALQIYAEGDSVLVFYSVMGDAYVIRSLDAGLHWDAPIYLGNSTKVKVSKLGTVLWLNIAFISRDWGQTWESFISPSSDFEYFRKNDNHTAMLGFYNSTTGQPSLYISTDSLQTWQLVNTFFQINESVIDDQKILISVYETVGTSLKQKLYRSHNAGATWVYLDTVSFYFRLIGSGKDNDYWNIGDSLAAIDAINGEMFFKSGDFGQTWQIINKSIPLLNDPISINNNAILTIMNNGVGRYIPSLDTTYTTISGMNGQSVYDITSHQNVLYVGTNLNVYASYNGGNTWVLAPFLPPNTSYSHYYSSFFVGDSLFFYVDNSLYYSFDNGVTWVERSGMPTNPSNPQNYGFITKVGSHLYCAAFNDNVYQSTDWGLSWQALPTIPNTSMIVASIINFQNELYVFSQNSKVYKYISSNQTWYDIGFTGWSSVGVVEYILKDMDGVLVALERNNDNISFYNSNTQTWVTPQMQGAPFAFSGNPMVIYDMKALNGVWIGSFYGGLYYSTDLGNHWQTLQTSPIPFENYKFTILNGVVFVGTFDFSGVWRRLGVLHTIQGNIFYDKNNDGIKDSLEPGLGNRIIYQSLMPKVSSSDSLGFYTLLTDSYNDTISVVMNDNAHHSNPSFLLSNGQDQIQDFGVYVMPNIMDLKIDLTNVSVFRPGFDSYLHISCQNIGSVVPISEIKLVIDSLLNVINISPSPTSFIGNTITWQGVSLNYLEEIYFDILVNTSTSAIISDSVHLLAKIYPLINDITSENNESVLVEPIVAAYDPNDKSCNFGNQITTSQIADAEYLEYVIRFQNLGNYPADFVRIEDTLNNHLELTTLQVMSASHPCTYELRDNIIIFKLDSIFLPPAMTNEPASHGYVKYRILCRDNTVLGSGIDNTAYIYFDFNPPVITPTISTLVVLPNENLIFTSTSISETNNASWSMYPNPASNEIYFEFSSHEFVVSTLSMFSIDGKSLGSYSIEHNKLTLDVSELPEGIYVCRVLSEKGEYVLTARVAVIHH